MPLTDYVFQPTLNTSTNDLISDFFIPALCRSVRYDRGVGFFSSGWLRIAATGMIDFAANGGRARWVTSPILSEDDWVALQKGVNAREDLILFNALKRNIAELKNALKDDTLSAIAWMVADGILDFKLALPRNKLERGDFHDKFGIFTDAEENHVVFNGSYNDSIQGTHNYESIKVFCSWEQAAMPWIKDDLERFENLWAGRDPNVVVFDLSGAAKENIVELRTRERPYPYKTWSFSRDYLTKPDKPQIPKTITLRDYQDEAIQAWFDASCQGLFEMATGTGKTITALAAVTKKIIELPRAVLIIIVPYKHLVEQWSEETEKFGYSAIKVVESSTTWVPLLSKEVNDFRMGLLNYICIVSTLDSFINKKFMTIMYKVLEESIIIIDEAHHAGSPKFNKNLPDRINYRLGLSATPIRYYDEQGTDKLLEYFGSVVYKFGLDKAIGKYLTPYYYHPVPIEMTEDEFLEFCVLTRQLAKYLAYSDDGLPEAAKRIAIKRTRLINNSSTKLTWLSTHIPNFANLEFTIFYVGEKLFEPTQILLGKEKKIRVHEFTQRQTNAQRKEILQRFSEGDLQALIAMKCLDEGVDIPPTRVAYFIASSGNPKEFIQRRGRVLRLYANKETAEIYDLLSIPPMHFMLIGKQHPDYNAVRAMVRREFKRVKEFAQLAENKYQAIEVIFDILKAVDLLDE